MLPTVKNNVIKIVMITSNYGEFAITSIVGVKTKENTDKQTLRYLVFDGLLELLLIQGFTLLCRLCSSF